ncbi:MAG: ABC transporter ATP-binding protein [Rhizobiales bacterium]|nr:ABC transporter ATP-binding protein [Hyphomicrobiales bacterium]MBO6699802.1 ABC transporter ATP-binding protein [Hyphomicrobiales bacterium]MBO6737340.1 ABC transporter ATP-binding protein [Hyphomicrobiales bacterium]MBO6911586.1 ABC transporter ATP-binding protein [Hyphomicrobiales bacterium]MBO6954992.1 ABC transporter ATP-binding protein [Hyphomicrobiales bacterium]
MTQATSAGPMISIDGLQKTYGSGFEALKNVDLTIEKGEILALLGPNGAGKTTLISAICGITVPTGGSITVGGHDILAEPGKTRRLIGLVPQEITLEPFETVLNTMRFSRGLFGLGANPALMEETLKKLSLWDKKDTQIKELSGGMKRRVLIAKAMAHEPQVLFLDEPTAGVDVELRKDMWSVVSDLKEAGVTIILTTHYIEEAEAIADRVAIISKGRILLVDEKSALIERMGKRSLTIDFDKKLDPVPDGLAPYDLVLSEDGMSATYTYDTRADRTGIGALLRDVNAAGLAVRDIHTAQSSLEEIFVSLVEDDVNGQQATDAGEAA